MSTPQISPIWLISGPCWCMTRMQALEFWAVLALVPNLPIG